MLIIRKTIVGVYESYTFECLMFMSRSYTYCLFLNLYMFCGNDAHFGGSSVLKRWGLMFFLFYTCEIIE